MHDGTLRFLLGQCAFPDFPDSSDSIVDGVAPDSQRN
jgi:hypothetical protein